jgi:hypothetical protein
MNFAAGKDGRGGLLDIAAESIAIIGAGEGPVAGYALSLRGDTLSRLGAESLLVGGRREQTLDGMKIDPLARQVLVSNDEATALVGPEIILVAGTEIVDGAAVDGTGIVTVAGGSVIRATGKVGGQPGGTISFGNSTATSPTGTGMGALLIASTAAPSRVVRNDIAAATGPVRGVVDIQDGAVLKSDGRLVLDATGDVKLASGAILQAKALDAASSTVSFGAVPNGAAGLVLTPAMLASLSAVNDLTLRSYGTMDFWGAVEFGGDGLKSLTLDAGALVRRASGDVSFRADALVVRNDSGTIAANTDPAAAGVLSLNARTITIDAGQSAARGFGEVTFTAEREIVFAGKGGFTAGTATHTADLTLSAPRLTAKAGSDQSATATGLLTTMRPSTMPTDLAPVAEFGGALTLRGARVVHAGTIDMPAGTVRLEATGANAGDGVTLAAGSLINVKAFRKTFFDQEAFVSAGMVELKSAFGDAVVANGAVIDLSAADGGNAGAFKVLVPNGDLVLAGDVRASAKADAVQGSFTLDTGELANLGALMSTLNVSGFFEKRHLMIRGGDVVLDGTTETRDLQIVADAGKITVRGNARVLADGEDGGKIRLVSRDNLEVESGALISARGSKGEGGDVNLETSQGALDLASGSIIDVSGAKLGGKVHVRAPRTGEMSGTVRAIRLGSTAVGARSVRAEAFWAYDNVTTIDQTVIDAVTNAANVFMAQAPGRVGSFDLAAGIELRSSGDMALATAWDLHDTRPGGRPGYLTLRAAGNVLLNHSLSDGFDGVDKSANLLTGESWSYRFVGGARADGADIFALRERAELAAADTGDVVVGANATIRTGTGDIQIAAGRSVIIERESSSPELFNPADPLQIISLKDAITADGLALQTAYTGWQTIAGGANYFYDPSNPTTIIELGQIFRADGRLNPSYRGWRSQSGMDVYIENPADPSQRVLFLDAFDADGVLLPQYRGWKSRYADGKYTVAFTGSDADGGSIVTDIMDIFLPDGTVDLRYLGWAIKPGTTTTVCWASFYCDVPDDDEFAPVDISVIVSADGSMNPNYSWWQATWSLPKMTLGGASTFDNEGTIYTAGRLSSAGALAVQSALDGNNYSGAISFAELGGDLSISAQQDVQGPQLFIHGCASWSTTCYLESQFDRQFVADWLLRRAGGVDTAGNPVTSAWGVDFSKFTQGVGTLGGGDVSIDAGNDISALTAVASDNGKAAGSVLQTWGGGNLTVTAGGNADANVFYVAQGQGRIAAEGSIGVIRVPEINSGLSNGYRLNPFATMLALGRGSFDLQAGGDISIGGMFNPTMVGMEGEAASSSDTRFNARPGTADGTYFSTYASDSSLNVQSLGGQVVMSSMPTATMMKLSKLNLGGDTSAGPGASPFFFYAPRVRVVSLQSDIVVGRDYQGMASGRMTLFPAQNGNLTLLAAHNIDLTANADSGANYIRGNNILVSDADPAEMPGVFNPGDKMFDDLLDPLTEVIASNESGANAPGKDKSRVHARSLYRAMDTEPVRIYALEGSILSSPIAKSIGNGIQIVVPKPAIVRAGLDIENLIFAGQHFDADDVTVIEAGRDITFDPFTQNRQTGNSIQIGGPGTLEVIAGRNVRLSSSDGIYSVGNGLNPWLQDGQGASIAVTTGAAGGIDYGAFADAYLNPANIGGTARDYTADLVAFMKARTGRQDLDAETAWLLFQDLPEVTRRELVRRVFQSELEFIGRREAATPESRRNYNEGYAAIAKLFPNESYAGDLNMFYSQIKTLEGGSIDLLVPGGKIDVGLTFVTPDINGGAKLRSPGDLGLMTLWGGDIRAFSAGSVLVNQNRVKTLGGGDIVIWSEGDIDAGRGAKTALIAPRPEVVYDPSTGTFTTKLAGEAAGSGIGTVKSRPDVPAGDVVLIAPKGIVDAGDAGIQSAGNVIIAALVVRNADNIQAAGTQVGVPTDTVDAGVLASAGNTAAAGQEGEAPQDAPNEQPSIIIVEVLGFGGGEGDSTPESEEERRRKSQRGYNPNSPFQVVGAGSLNQGADKLLSESEKQVLSR